MESPIVWPNEVLLPWKWLSKNLNSLLCCWVRSGKSMKNLQKSDMKILDILMRCLWNISFVVHGYLVSYVKVLFQSFPICRMCCCCTSRPLFWSQNTIGGTETDPKIANCNYFRSIKASLHSSCIASTNSIANKLNSQWLEKWWV